MLIRTGRFVIFMLLLLPVSAATADVVTLKTGETIEGEVLDVTRSEVTIKTKVHNITTTQTIRRSKIADIEYKPLPDDFWGSGKKTKEPDTKTNDAESEDADSDRSARTTNRVGRNPESQYVVIPIKGGIGSEVTEYGVRRALTQSRGRAQHIVFVVDSPGGYVYSAVAILDLLKEFDDEFEYHCVIEEGAISAASVFAAASDHIYVHPDARLGGAVAYSSENSTGATEVDAKFNSIWSANIASRADAKGHSGDAFRAMVVLEAELWQGEDGTLTAARTAGSTQIDSASTILTIRASQMIESGMAKAIGGEPSEIGTIIGDDNWTEYPKIGERAMAQTGRERTLMESKHNEAIAEYREALAEYETENPLQFTYTVIRAGNNVYRLDPSSMRVWLRRCDRSISACKTMLRSLKELASINAKAQRTKALHLVTPDDLGHDAYVELEHNLDWLRNHRNNPPARNLGG
ncbi:MAG: ATP-dependent Clp protease proteolytic subunit [Phycisphaerales bacterium]